MPTNKNAETRYIILDKLLANRYCNYNTEDLWRRVNEELEDMKMLPVTKRTIESDLNYMEHGPFQADIEHYQFSDVSQHNNKTVTKTCHRYRDPSFSIFKKKMTDNEKYLLSEALSILGQFDGLPDLDGLNALKKSMEVKMDRQIVSFSKNPLNSKNHFGVLFTAISERYVIGLHYHKFTSPDEDRVTVVHPYMLKEYNRRWFLIAGADDTGKLLNFALDRIDAVEALPGIKYRPYNDDLNERFVDIVGVTFYDDEPLKTIVFWVSDNSVDYVATKPLHESQHNISGENEEPLRQKFPMLEGGRFFSIECKYNYELRRELASYGGELVVLSPDDIRQKVRQYVEGLVEMYDKTEK